MSNTMIQPEQIQQLPFLTDQQKSQYRSGLENLWAQYNKNPPNSKERAEAESKIRTASVKLMQQLAGSRGDRPQSGGGQQRTNQPQMNQSQQMQQMQQMGQQQGNPQQQMAMAQAQAQAQAAQARQQQLLAQQARGQQGGQQGGQQRPPLSQGAQQELDSSNPTPPPTVSTHQHEAWKHGWRTQGYELLARRDMIYRKAQALSLEVKQSAQQNGGQSTPELQQRVGEAKKAFEAAAHRWKTFKAQGESGQYTNPQQTQQQQQMMNQVQSVQQQQMQQQRPHTQQGVNATPQQPDVKSVNADQRNSLSPPQPQNGFQQNSQALPTQQSVPAQSGPQGLPQQSQTTQSQQQNPQTATQQNPPQNFSQGNMQHQSSQQQRPQINTQQVPNPTQIAQQQQQQQQTPGSALPPNSANQQHPQRPQPLNHQQAMSQAAESYSRSQAQQQQMQQQQPQVPNGLPFNTQPASATQQNTPTQVYPNLAPTQHASANTKFPIAKTLQLDPRTQTAVTGPPSRPTLGNQGMMYNPGIQRAPPYTLEGEGDRVLSKRKLDELVRQVTGAAPSSDNSESSSVLAPEVEESMLQVADNFVDDVIGSACRLAKLRPNQTLDIRDIQIVLERNYGIRIPGYSLDEVRTVRKFQPAPGWQSKMQAIQAGKVMGSREP